MEEVFFYRDQIAHGKTVVEPINRPIDGNVDDLSTFSVGPDWKDYSTINNATKAVNDTREYHIGIT